MPQAGVGVDLVDITRMEEVLRRRPSFATSVFTEDERAYCERRARPAQHFAARYAARGAVMKALGTSFAEGVDLTDVSVTYGEGGRPEVVLKGHAQAVAHEKGVREVALSISFTHDVAVANAVAVTEDVKPRQEERTSAKEELGATFRAARTLLDELDELERVEAARTGEA